jgi:hypothetical protein
MGANAMSGTLTLPDTTEDLFQESSTALTSDREYPEKEWAPWHAPGAIVGDATREQSFRESLSQIETYRILPQDWDTYGGLPASDVSLAFAGNLLNALRLVPELFAPYVCPISTGVYLEWRLGDARLYFEVEDDSVLFVMEEGDRVVEDGEDTAFDVPHAVELVRRFHRSGV